MVSLVKIIYLRNAAFLGFFMFKEWWDKTKKPEIVEKAKTSILQKLRESQAIVDQRKEQQGSNLNRNNFRPER